MKRIIKLYKDSFTGLTTDIWKLAFITLINRSGTMVLLFMSIYLTQELKFSFVQAGFVISMFGIGSLAGTFIGGKLSDLIGFYKVMVLSLILSGSMFIVLSFIPSFKVMCIAVFITSLFAEAFRPANYLAIKSYSQSDSQTRSLALIRLAINLGFSLAPAIGGFLAYQVGFKWLFIIDGVTCMLAGVLFFWMLPEKKDMDKKEKQVNVPLSAVLKNTKYLWYLIFVFLSGITFMQLFTTIPVYLRDHFLLNESQIGLILALNGVLIVVMEMPLVFLLEKRFSSLRLIGLGCLLFAMSYAFFMWNGTGVFIAIVFMIALTFGEMINFPFSTSWALNQSKGKGAGQYMALYTMIFSSAYIVAPTLGFKIIEWQGFAMLWLIMFVMAAVAGIGILTLQRMKS